MGFLPRRRRVLIMLFLLYAFMVNLNHLFDFSRDESRSNSARTLGSSAKPIISPFSPFPKLVTRQRENASSLKLLPKFQGTVETAMKYEMQESFQIVNAYAKETGKNIHIEDLMMPLGGQPIRNFIISTWRSGSTFLTQIVESHPGTFTHFEPLAHHKVTQFHKSGSTPPRILQTVENLLNCNYKDEISYMQYARRFTWMFEHSTNLWKYCQTYHRRNPAYHRRIQALLGLGICRQPGRLAQICRLFPFQVTKTVRLRLRLVQTLLDNKKFDIRVVYLVRDPRAVMQSRLQLSWCRDQEACINATNLCRDMVDDFHFAARYRKKYPGRFLVIRHEELSLSPYTETKKIFALFRLVYFSNIEDFLREHTVSNRKPTASHTYRVSESVPFHWKWDFAKTGNFSQVELIQTSCKTAMELWGYAPATEDTLTSFNSLRKPPWPEMLVQNSSICYAEKCDGL